MDLSFGYLIKPSNHSFRSRTDFKLKMLKIRCQPHGKRGKIIFRIVVMEARTRRDGRPQEVIGFYDPQLIQKAGWAGIDLERYDKLLVKGAKPNPQVKSIVRRLRSLNNGSAKPDCNQGVTDQSIDRRIDRNRCKVCLEQFAHAVGYIMESNAKNFSPDFIPTLEKGQHLACFNILVKELDNYTTKYGQKSGRQNEKYIKDIVILYKELEEVAHYQAPDEDKFLALLERLRSREILSQCSECVGGDSCRLAAIQEFLNQLLKP